MASELRTRIAVRSKMRREEPIFKTDFKSSILILNQAVIDDQISYSGAFTALAKIV